jgi:hypothetical protein
MGYEMGYEDERDKEFRRELDEEFRREVEEKIYTDLAEKNRSIKKVKLSFGARPNCAEYILYGRTEDGQWLNLNGFKEGRVPGERFPYPDNRGTWIVEADEDGEITKMIRKVSD